MNKILSSIKINSKEHSKLKDASLKLGLSVDELVSLIINHVVERIIEIPEENLNDYKNAAEIEKLYQKALKDDKNGKLLDSLPDSILALR